MGAIQKKVIEQSKRNAASRFIHAKSDRKKMAGWKSDMNKILDVLNVQGQEGNSSKTSPVGNSRAITEQTLIVPQAQDRLAA